METGEVIRTNAVTGASGHIGNVLVRKLLERGEKVRVLALHGDDLTALKGLEVEVYNGGVNDKEILRKMFLGCERVFHLAGIISIGGVSKKVLKNVNVEGTKNVVDVCKELGIAKLVYTSSVHAIDDKNGGVAIKETRDFDSKRITGAYAKSKAEATHYVIEQIEKNNLHAVIVFPSGVIGPYEYKRSNIGQLILSFLKRKIYACINGAYNFVDVRDVADGIILASEKGRNGECYILSGEKMTVKEMFDVLEKKTKISAPKRKVPMWLVKLFAPLCELWYKIKKTVPLFTRYALHTLTANCNISHEKASKELGYKPRPVEESLCDAVDWIDLREKKKD